MMLSDEIPNLAEHIAALSKATGWPTSEILDDIHNYLTERLLNR